MAFGLSVGLISSIKDIISEETNDFMVDLDKCGENLVILTILQNNLVKGVFLILQRYKIARNSNYLQTTEI